jgi:hypothetical protein
VTRSPAARLGRGRRCKEEQTTDGDALEEPRTSYTPTMGNDPSPDQDSRCCESVASGRKLRDGLHERRASDPVGGGAEVSVASGCSSSRAGQKLGCGFAALPPRRSPALVLLASGASSVSVGSCGVNQ